MSENKDFYLYVLLCDSSILYTGIALDPSLRLQQHQQGHPYGAKFTRRFEHLDLVYQVKVGNRATAQSIEIKFKKLSATIKKHIIKQQCELSQLLTIIN